jgi:hypothetical protein
MRLITTALELFTLFGAGAILFRWYIMTRAALVAPTPSRLTVILPMDDIQRSAVARAVAPLTKPWVPIVAISLVFGVFMAGTFAVIPPVRPVPSFDVFPLLGGAAGLLCALFAATLGWHTVRALRTDLSEMRFCRTTGDMRVTRVGSVWHLNTGDRDLIVPSGIAGVIGDRLQGEIDYSAYGHLIFEIRSVSGHIVYQNEFYDPPRRPSRTVPA